MLKKYFRIMMLVPLFFALLWAIVVWYLGGGLEDFSRVATQMSAGLAIICLGFGSYSWLHSWRGAKSLFALGSLFAVNALFLAPYPHPEMTVPIAIVLSCILSVVLSKPGQNFALQNALAIFMLMVHIWAIHLVVATGTDNSFMLFMAAILYLAIPACAYNLFTEEDEAEVRTTGLASHSG